jgi:membrane protein implicated in regulation of membrane protease activity
VTGQLLGLAALVALVIWLVGRVVRRVGRAPDEHGRAGAADIDQEELEAAEREVRDLGGSVREDDGFAGDDWGPGAAGRGSQSGA